MAVSPAAQRCAPLPDRFGDHLPSAVPSVRSSAEQLPGRLQRASSCAPHVARTSILDTRKILSATIGGRMTSLKPPRSHMLPHMVKRHGERAAKHGLWQCSGRRRCGLGVVVRRHIFQAGLADGGGPGPGSAVSSAASDPESSMSWNPSNCSRSHMASRIP